MTHVEVVRLARHECQSDMRTCSLHQQIRARWYHADIFDQVIRCRGSITVDKTLDIPTRARSFIAGDAKPDPAGHSPDRYGDSFRQAFRRYAAMIIHDQWRIRWRRG